ncbi:MAG: hypothetical protein LBP74_05025 [Treponema sp.]|jgi:hypothetical protein|nr:hypothetical protein [Treponema sp.]
MMQIMFNEDWMHFYLTRHENHIKPGEEELRDFIYQYRGTQITDFSLNVNGTISSFPSKTLESFVDKYRKTTENNGPVDYRETFADICSHIFAVKGLDHYAIWIKALREINIRPWISIRMNDCHGNLEEGPDIRRSEFVNAHPELWRIRHRRPTEYFDKCLDYLKAEVSGRIYSYIEEVLDRYDPDGLELDFTREILCFPPGYEAMGRRALYDLMKRIKALTLEYTKKRNHKIAIGVLVHASPITNLNAGLDIALWARDCLVDVVVALPRWETINTDIPIGIWKELLPPSVQFGSGQQILIRPYREYKNKNTPASITTMAMAFGQAAASLSCGADFIYLYNYMDMQSVDSSVGNPPQSVIEKNCQEILFKNLGALESVLKMKRRHVLSYDDSINYWEAAASVLPLKLRADGPFRNIRIVTGTIPAKAKVSLVLGIQSDQPLTGEEFEVYVNSRALRLSGLGDLNEAVCDLPAYRFEIPADTFIENFVVAEIKAKKQAAVHYAEVVVEPDL